MFNISKSSEKISQQLDAALNVFRKGAQNLTDLRSKITDADNELEAKEEEIQAERLALKTQRETIEQKLSKISEFI